MVDARFSWVTAGFIEPGVRRGSGRPTGERSKDGDAFEAFASLPGRLALGPGSHHEDTTTNKSPITPTTSAAQIHWCTVYGSVSQATPSWSPSSPYWSL